MKIDKRKGRRIVSRRSGEVGGVGFGGEHVEDLPRGESRVDSEAVALHPIGPKLGLGARKV